MILDYCNGFDLKELIKIRGTLSQIEALSILRQVAIAIHYLNSLNIVHRDIKPANILLHFPNNPEVDSMDTELKREFLINFDFVNGQFKALISDFGLST